jgi:hypothetical protein
MKEIVDVWGVRHIFANLSVDESAKEINRVVRWKISNSVAFQLLTSGRSVSREVEN